VLSALHAHWTSRRKPKVPAKPGHFPQDSLGPPPTRGRERHRLGLTSFFWSRRLSRPVDHPPWQALVTPHEVTAGEPGAPVLGAGDSEGADTGCAVPDLLQRPWTSFLTALHVDDGVNGQWIFSMAVDISHPTSMQG
jgi:hypothetical protein